MLEAITLSLAAQAGLQSEFQKQSQPTCVVRGVVCRQKAKDSMFVDVLFRQDFTPLMAHYLEGILILHESKMISIHAQIPLQPL